MKKHSAKLLKKLLNESYFNPNTPPGTLKLVLDQDDPVYLETRAKEYISEAQISIGVDSLSKEMYHDKMVRAISLLVMARLLRK